MSEDASATQLATMELDDIMRVLPHRYPFLLVDRIVDIDGDNSAIGIKNVTFNEPHFQGHFPGKPVMPGVLIIEAMAQTAGAISLRALNYDKPGLVYFMTIDNAKFRRHPRQEDQTARQHSALRLRGEGGRCAGGGGRSSGHDDRRRIAWLRKHLFTAWPVLKTERVSARASASAHSATCKVGLKLAMESS
jgi:3-hydroxyacyl-[acyl-carrier-protein] dehydratase